MTGGPSPARLHGAKFSNAAARRRAGGSGATRQPRPRSRGVFATVVILVVGVDQSTKAVARAVLPLHQMVPLIGPWLGFRRTNYLPVTIPGREGLAILGGIVILVCLFLLVSPLGFRIETHLSETAFVLGAAYLLLRVLTGDLPRERLGPDRPRGHSGRRYLVGSLAAVARSTLSWQSVVAIRSPAAGGPAARPRCGARSAPGSG